MFTQKPQDSDSSPYRPALLDTIRVYLTVTEPKVHARTHARTHAHIHTIVLRVPDKKQDPTNRNI